MIDVRVQALGGPEIAATIRDRHGAVRTGLVDELTQIGAEIRTRAQAAAPKRTGIMASRIIDYFGTRAPRTRKGNSIGTQIRDVKWKDGRILFTVQPTGRVAHLMERGVNASFRQSPGRRSRNRAKWSAGEQGPQPSKGMNLYARTLRIAPRPFFQPAVDSVGGAGGVNSRLQAVVDRVASGRAA